eukprot:TRINITY_DN2521_c0_g1_i2.p1 TRINITY_DN2521_c0_g1~~TRINITY_DN2521_c0_g1_i2.p1  ORF type:complete len:215 (+),score=64.25 TRINITY_DN2521_c0_g1_i2:623-1267(+)
MRTFHDSTGVLLINMSLLVIPIVLGSLSVMCVVTGVLICKRVKRLKKAEEEKRRGLEETRARIRQMMAGREVVNVPEAKKEKDKSLAEEEINELIIKYTVEIEDAECCICLEAESCEASSPYGNTDLWVRLPCSHVLHAACLASLLATTTAANRCPLCRNPVDHEPVSNPLAAIHIIDIETPEHNEQGSEDQDMNANREEMSSVGDSTETATSP